MSTRPDIPILPAASSDSEDELVYQRTITTQDRSLPFRLYLLTGLSAIGGFLFGYDTGVVSGAMLLVRDEFQLTDVWHEMIVSATIGAAFVSALVGAWMSDRYGRKPTILFASVLFAVGALFMGVANGKGMLLLGRIGVGIGVGLASMSVPVYIAEVCPAQHRGALVTLNNLFITGGQFVATIVCGLLVNVDHGWRYMLGIAATPAIVQFIGFYTMPESPRYLVKKGKYQAAAEVLSQVRSRYDPVREELEDMKLSTANTADVSGGVSTVLREVVRSPSVRRALFVGCSLQLFQQISGINTVMYYSASIIEMAGVGSHSTAIWLATITSGVNFFCTFIGLYLIDRKGRRPLLFGSLGGVIVSLLFLALGFHLMESNSPAVTNFDPSSPSACLHFASCSDCIDAPDCGFCYASWNGTCLPNAASCPDTFSTSSCPSEFKWIPVLGLCTYLFFFAPGMGPLPWTINSEIYPMWCRSVCTGIATSVNWISNLFVSMTFLSIINGFGRDGAFFFYGVLSIVGFVLFYFIVPETKGLSLEEMETLFKRGRRDGVRYSRISNPLET